MKFQIPKSLPAGEAGRKVSLPAEALAEVGGIRPSFRFALNSFLFLAIFFSFLQINSPALATEGKTDFQASIPLEEVYIFDQIGSKMATETGEVKGVAIAFEQVGTKAVEVVIPVWEILGIEGLLVASSLAFLVWIFFYLRHRHRKEEIIAEPGKHQAHLSFSEIRFRLWLLKHLPLRLQPGFIREHSHRPFTVKDDILILIFHPFFKALRYAALLWLIFSLSMGSLGFYVLTHGALPVFAASWYNASWDYREKITIDNTKVPNTDQSNFPVLINTTDTDWKDAANSGHVAQSDGGDLLFTASDGTTKLDHEIESYTPSSGALIAWVEIPTLSYSADTEIYIYYGNDAGGLDEQNVAGTWDTNYKMVQHLEEISGTHQDSTSNNNDGTESGGVTQNAVGKIDGADDFDGTNDYIRIPNSEGLNPTNVMSGFAWVKGVAQNQNYFVTCYDTGTDERAYAMTSGIGADDKFRVIITDTGVYTGATKLNYETSIVVFDDTWHFVGYTFDAGTLKLFVDGIEDTNPTKTVDDAITTIHNCTADITVGARLANNNPADLFGGSIDEVRISATARSGDWIKTSYNSQGSPSTFYSVAAEEAANSNPNAPTNLSPSNGATNQGLTPTLTTAGAFSDPDDGDTHANSQWQISTTSGDYSSTVYDSDTDAVNLTSIIIPVDTLSAGTTYYWHVRYQDNNSSWSSYSAEFSFRTSYAPSTPNDPSPSSGALDQKITLTLSNSAFSDSDGGASHTASQWLIRNLDDASYASPVYNSWTDASNLISISVPAGNLSKNTTYFWKVRYRDDQSIWSSYSSETAFSTGVVPITVIAVGATEYKEGETASLVAQVKDADGAVVNNATCAINVYSPSRSKLVDGASMTYITSSSGLYYRDYTIPSTTGVYIYDTTCTHDGQTGYSAHTFHVAAWIADITSIKATVEGLNNISAADVWSAANRSLTDPDSIWEYALASIGSTGSIGKLLKDNIDAQVSSRGTSDLTAANVWSAAERTLTSSANFNDPTAAATAQAVWSEATRTLTSYGNDITAADVWDVLTSSLTTVGSIGKQLTENVDVAVSTRASATALAEHETAQATSRTKVADIQTRVTAVQSDVSTIKSDVSAIKSGVSSVEATIDGVWSQLHTLTGTLPSGYTGVYEQLVLITNTLSGLGVLKGSGAESLYSLSAENKDDAKYLKNKILDLQATIEINRILLASGGQNSVFSTWYTFDSVVLNMLIANPTNRKTKIPFKAYLPKEAKQEHVISSGGLKIEYDEAAGSYVALGEFELEGGESITRKVEMRDIWLIDEGELVNLKKQTEELADEAKKTAYSAQVTILKNDTLMRLERILRKQKDATATPQDHILAFRENQEDLVVVKESLKKMTDLVTSVGAGRGLLASVAGINTSVAWGIIVALVTGVGLLGFMFYSMWKHQMMIVAQISGGETGAKEMVAGAMTAGTAGVSVPSLISLPKIEWDSVLPRLKKIFLVLVAGGTFLGVVRGAVYFKPWQKLRKQEQPAVMAPVESEKEVSPSPSPSPTPLRQGSEGQAPEPKKVTILETETGWLNVREGPGISFGKVTRVDVGKEFVTLDRETNEVGEEWVKIRVDEETEGWVVGKYVHPVK